MQQKLDDEMILVFLSTQFYSLCLDLPFIIIKMVFETLRSCTEVQFDPENKQMEVT